MKKHTYSKRQLATRIIELNPDTFIPMDVLIDDITYIYKIRKIIRRIINMQEYDIILLKNLIQTSYNIFGNNCIILLQIILSEEEYECLKTIRF